ncbi:ORF6C domain-containing protein [Clostridium sp.]|uniref:ORF6C domain-containing protein n=1 Tax=Clostridium sp. TaxID=1506 RepID=UPI00321652E8
MNKLENKLSSREVANMMEMGHSELLRKIDGINKDFRESKIAFSKYWVEDTYKAEGNNKSYREFQITKRGCEFLANKTTGTKGNLFTDRYMDKFAEMENYIENKVPMLSAKEQLKLQLQILEEQDMKINEVNSKVEALEDNMPLFNIECKELQALVRSIGIKALGGYKTQAYKDNSLRGRVYADIQQQLKREFGVTRYEAIKRNQLDKATEIVNNYKTPTVMTDEIVQANNQICLECVM